MRRLILALFVALLANVAAAATISAPPTQAGLTAALAAVKPGDTVTIRGAAPHLAITGKTWSPAVTLDARGAVIAGLQLKRVDGLAILGGDYRASAWDGGLYVINSRHISASAITVTDPGPHHTGVVFRSTAFASLTDATITGSGVGVEVIDATDIEITKPTLQAISGDGITIASAQRVRVSDVACRGFMNDGVHHPDCVQAWSVPGHVQAADISILRPRCNGAMQCVDDFGGDARGVLRLTIADGDALISYPQAFAEQKSVGALAYRNHAHTLPGSKFRASIHFTAPGVVHWGNTADAALGKPAWADAVTISAGVKP